MLRDRVKGFFGQESSDRIKLKDITEIMMTSNHVALTYTDDSIVTYRPDNNLHPILHSDIKRDMSVKSVWYGEEGFSIAFTGVIEIEISDHHVTIIKEWPKQIRVRS